MGSSGQVTYRSLPKPESYTHLADTREVDIRIRSYLHESVGSYLKGLSESRWVIRGILYGGWVVSVAARVLRVSVEEIFYQESFARHVRHGRGIHCGGGLSLWRRSGILGARLLHGDVLDIRGRPGRRGRFIRGYVLGLRSILGCGRLGPTIAFIIP